MLTGSRSREAAELRGGARARVGCLQSREAVSETMSRGSEIHVFWGAPIGPLKMTVSQEPTSSVSTADPWTKVQLLYNQHSLHLKDEKCKNKNVEDDQTLGATGSPDLLSGHCLANSRHRCVHVKGDFIHCISEAQTLESEKSHPLGMSDVTRSEVQICGCKGQHLTEDEKYQKLFSENKKITVEQHKHQSNICGQNVQKNCFQLDPECVAALNLVCSTEQIDARPGAVDMRYIPTEHEIRNQRLEKSSSDTVDKPGSGEAVRKVSDLNVSTDTEFLSIVTSSQFAFLAQRKCKGENSINKEPEIEPEASHGKIKVTKDNLIQPDDDDFAERHESRENQAYSLELFSPVSPERKISHIHVKPDEGLEENVGSQELFSLEDKLPSNEIRIESYNSGILCSQVNALHRSSGKRNWTSEGQLGHLKVPPVSKKLKLVPRAGGPAAAKGQRVSGFKGSQKTALLANCDSKSRKYNCLVIVLSPCHVKEINIKSGPNSGSTVPLATLVVIDQSEVKKKVVLWRAAAFWALTVFLGDILLLTDVTIHEGRCVGETVLQSTFTSQLLNLGSYSSVQPEEYCIWEFRYLLAQRNCLLETLELHTTPWSSCERLFDDDVRAVTFNTKFQKSVSSSVKMSDLATHLQDKCSGVILIKAQIVELLFPVTAAQQIVVNAHSSLKSVVSSLPNVTYTGCASCGLELETDGNKIYKQCFSCLPCTRKKVFYRPALMTVAEGVRKVCVRVGSELMEKILLNISPDWLGRVIAPGAEVTYGMVAADVLLALLAAGGAPCDLTVRSLFAGDPNGYPLQQGFSLLGFSPAVRMRAGPGGAQAQPPSDWSEQ
ncbi:shieldin complex subunit 2 isoform 4-T5 [Molossus nigricans]